jgi:predicted O-methyltransferase YrrM
MLAKGISRSGMADKSKKLILSTMKDEAPYILEWLAYHRVLGFTDFLVYTNDCSDGTDLLLDRLQVTGHVTHERNKVLKRGPQKSAYKSALAHPLFQASDWVMTLDADEFLNIQLADGRIDALLARFPDADVIPVCWRLFSNNGKEKLLDGLVIEELIDAQSTQANPGEVGRFVKSLFRPHPEMSRIGSHAPVYTDTFEDSVTWGCDWIRDEADADPRRPRLRFGYDVAQVNHYAVRTIDAFLLKRARGDVNFMKDRLEEAYWTRWCQGGHRDTSILKMVKDVHREMQRLCKDPIVKALHEAGKCVHREKLSALLEVPEIRAFKSRILACADTSEPAGDATVSNAHAGQLALKAPRRHENRLRLLRDMPRGGRCAEIGVWNGAFSQSILETTAPRELVLIDPWELLAEQEESAWTHKRHKDHAFMKSMWDHVTGCYGALSHVQIRKGFSQDVLASFEDGYFDWVYVDGNHRYDAVRADLRLAFQKVRPGGIIAGDDFFWTREGRMHVKEAVIDEMRAQGMQNRPKRFGQQFMITVPQAI